MYSAKKVFCKILQCSQDNSCHRIFPYKPCPTSLRQKDSMAGVFLKILHNFQKKVFHRKPMRNWFYKILQNLLFFSFYLGFLSQTFTNQRTVGGGGLGISLTPYYHFYPLHRNLDISRAITAESSPLHIASSQTRAGSLWFPSASC